MILAPVQLRRVSDLDELSVDICANEALLAHGLEELAEFALAALNERRAHFDLGAIGPCEHGLGNLRRTLPLHGATTSGTVRCASACIEQAEIVVDLRNGADGRARIMTRGL